MSRPLAILTICSFFIFGCQTNMLNQFSRLQPGMEKHDVLERMGNPKTTTRMHGKDRWIYVFYEDNVRYEKEIHFEQGVAIYIGDVWQSVPEKRAETVDAQHETLEKTLFEEKENNSKQNTKAYQDYEKQVRGEDRVRYMPEFTPVQ